MDDTADGRDTGEVAVLVTGRSYVGFMSSLENHAVVLSFTLICEKKGLKTRVKRLFRVKVMDAMKIL